MIEPSATLKYDLVLPIIDVLKTQMHVILPMPSQPCDLSVHWISAEYFRVFFFRSFTSQCLPSHPLREFNDTMMAAVTVIQ